MKFALSVPDFRRPDKGNIRHRLADIIMLMILGRASGHVARSEIIEFGRHNLNRFRKMGMLRNGVPSEATMCRVEQGIDELSMAMQKDIIDRIRKKGGDFLIELKANQRSLRYGIEDKIRTRIPLHSYTEGPELGHGRIETRTYRIHDGLGMIADREKWGGCMTVVEYESDTVSKSTGAHSTERRLYVTSLAADTPLLGAIVRTHWSIESMHWGLDVNLQQDRIWRRSSRSARNLDTIQRIVHSVFSVWKRLRRKMADRRKGMAEIMRLVPASFTKLIRFLCQK